MNANSPELNIKPRTEAEAQQDMDHRRHTMMLTMIRNFLELSAPPEMQLVKEAFLEAIDYALEQLHQAQAKRLRER